MKSHVYEKDDEFILNDYNNVKPFSSFFPSIAGLWGKPMWVFFVNRGQAIACMGVKDKDGALMEFIAANKAYRQTSLHGFRTFVKIRQKNKELYYEPFKNSGRNTNAIKQSMRITSYSLSIKEVNKNLGLEFMVEYFTVPSEKLPALARILSVKNISENIQSVECIDGLPMIIPYGTTNFLLKNMSRIGEAWFGGVRFAGKYKIPIYKLKVEPLDRPEVIKINAANFYAGFYYDKNNELIFPRFITDSDVIFNQMNDFTLPIEFIKNKKIPKFADESAKNKTPSAMGYFKTKIKKNECFQYYSVIGCSLRISDITSFIERLVHNSYLKEKKKENRFIIKNIQNKILFKSSLNMFDNYCQQTYLDNTLRGGYPVILGAGKNSKVYYAYSRIHGDMEREYNDFVIMPQYFSHGNGSYRDVNQNRRNDVFFNPETGEEPLVYFLNLIQLDGFNPLGIIGSEFWVRDKDILLKYFKKREQRKKVEKFISNRQFTLGDFFNFIEQEKIIIPSNGIQLLDKLISASEKIDRAEPKTGYWSDHWHYNIDLMESFFGVYPEKFQEIFIQKEIFTFYDNPFIVMPRKEKYVLFQNRPRQLDAVYRDPEKVRIIETRHQDKHTVRTEYGEGRIFKTNLLGKLLSLVANKYASLDPEGKGVELESERSNWNDALNGLPGLFGSSTSETLELKRLIIFIIDSIDKLNQSFITRIWSAEEIIDFLFNLEQITKKHTQKYAFWDQTHAAKEKYWKKTKNGVSGKVKSITFKKIKEILWLFLKKVDSGLNKSFDEKSNVIFTYFENEVVKYEILKQNKKPKKNWNNLTCIKALKFTQKPLPLFLEGPVHYLRINKDKEEAKKIYKNVMKSKLYDRKLKMYKVNASLKKASIDIGRLKIFTPGWLENESIWLHMEYKYLLELLRNGLIDEYYKSAQTALVPFMNPHVYGRSIYENVSFIVSSAHPDEKLHGQGFTARLSGSTAEFLSIWLLINAGLNPFYIEEGQLCLKLKPQLMGSLFIKKKEVVKNYDHIDIAGDFSFYKENLVQEIILPVNCLLFKFLGKVIVVYHNPGRKNTYGKNGVKIQKMELTYFNNEKQEITGDVLREPYSYDVRNGRIKRIDAYLG